jgi:hypothetical protein
MPMDKRIQALLKLGVPYDQNGPEPIPAGGEPEEFGVENISLDDLSAKIELNILRDHLTVLGQPEDIIRVHRDHPDRLNAVRATRDKCSSSCDKCKSDSGDSGEEKQDEEDK